MSRALSVPSIYAPPQVPLRGTSTDNIPHGSGRTPGRRGDKRPRLEEGDDLNRKKRKAGRIVPERLKIDDRPWSAISANEDEDIFGSRSASVVSRAPSAVPRSASVASRPEILEPMEGSSSKVKRTRVPQMVLDNKAVGVITDVADTRSFASKRSTCSKPAATLANMTCSKMCSGWPLKGYTLHW